MEKRVKKPLRDTKFGQWLKEHDSELFAFFADLVPDRKLWGVLKRILLKAADLTDEEKQAAISLMGKK